MPPSSMLRRHARRKSLASHESNDFREALGQPAGRSFLAGKPGFSRPNGSGLLLASLCFADGRCVPYSPILVVARKKLLGFFLEVRGGRVRSVVRAIVLPCDNHKMTSFCMHRHKLPKYSACESRPCQPNSFRELLDSTGSRNSHALW